HLLAAHHAADIGCVAAMQGSYPGIVMGDEGRGLGKDVRSSPVPGYSALAARARASTAPDTRVEASTSACNSAPAIGSSSSLVASISAQNSASFMVASKAERNIAIRPVGIPGGAITARPTVPLLA